MSSVRFPNTSKITAPPQCQPAPHTGDQPAQLPIQPLHHPAPIYITYLLPAIIVLSHQNNAAAQAVHPLEPPVPVPAVAFAALPAHPQPHQPAVHASGLPLPPNVLTNHTIRLEPLAPSLPLFCPVPVTCAQPCQPFPSKLKVQLVKSQSHLTLICNKQLVGVIVNTLAALPAAQEL